MDASVDSLLDDVAGIVGEIVPLRPCDDAMPLPESVKAVA
jgi:hypothetical protein